MNENDISVGNGIGILGLGKKKIFFQASMTERREGRKKRSKYITALIIET